jgi:regulator of protease activity HflC (stomatin/prohibitin superfamily)
MAILVGIVVGFVGWFAVRHLAFGFFTVDQNERAVKTVFGRAQRLGDGAPDPVLLEMLDADEHERYRYPQLRVIPPGGPYLKLPWERVYKVSIATETVSMAWDPEEPSANRGGTVLEAVTKDQLNTGLTGQIRWRVSERNLYAYLFGVKNPLAHTMGFFISVLRQRIASFEAQRPAHTGHGHTEAEVDPLELSGVSINDLRKNLRDLNDYMLEECREAEARYGVVLDASLITGIDPPAEVESALAAINTAHNHVSSEISLARASADQKIVQSKRAVEIETLRSQAEVEPLLSQANQLMELKRSGGSEALAAYLRNVRLEVFERAGRIFVEAKS